MHSCMLLHASMQMQASLHKGCMHSHANALYASKLAGICMQLHAIMQAIADVKAFGQRAKAFAKPFLQQVAGFAKSLSLVLKSHNTTSCTIRNNCDALENPITTIEILRPNL